MVSNERRMARIPDCFRRLSLIAFASVLTLPLPSAPVLSVLADPCSSVAADPTPFVTDYSPFAPRLSPLVAR